MLQQVVHVLRGRLRVVHGAQADHSLVCEKGYRRLARKGTDLRDKNVDSKVKLFSLDQEWVCDVELRHVVLGKSKVGHIVEPLCEHDTAPLLTCLRLEDESMVSCSHSLLQHCPVVW